MNRHFFRAILILSMLVAPAGALAGAPSNVTGLSARFEDGQVTVRWDGAENAKTYRVYYGQKSILDNDGEYDDFAAVDGDSTELVISDLPPYPQIFLAVLAVNADDEESRSFVEELQLDMTGGEADGQKTEREAPAPSRKEREANTVGLLSAVAQSPETVQLTFSMNVQVQEDRAAEAFTALDNAGNPLRLSRIVIEGNIVTLVTETQSPGRKYAVRANDPVTGEAADGRQSPVDQTRNITGFTGYENNDEEVPPAKTDTAPDATSGIADEGGPAAVASVVPPPRGTSASRSGLYNSGVPVLGVILASGAIAGWRRVRRRIASK
ncbi:hypothetical protein HYW84_01420 [Candidatus Peregrinibacteria bacterium]|nr:hypothetical protein [Candidatus Peregrinibacteria bacterium]